MIRAVIAAGALLIGAAGCSQDAGPESNDEPPQIEASESLVGSWSGTISYERGMFVGESTPAALDVSSHASDGTLSGSVEVEGAIYEMSGSAAGGEVVMFWNEARFAGAEDGIGSISGEWEDLDPEGSAGSFRFSQG